MGFGERFTERTQSHPWDGYPIDNVIDDGVSLTKHAATLANRRAFGPDETRLGAEYVMAVMAFAITLIDQETTRGEH